MEAGDVASARAHEGRMDRQSVLRRTVRAGAPERGLVGELAGRGRGEIRYRVRPPAWIVWRSLRAPARAHEDRALGLDEAARQDGRGADHHEGVPQGPVV